MLKFLVTFWVLGFAVKRSTRKKYDLDYHELKELREEMIVKNQRERDLFTFYAKASKKYTSWTQPKPEHFQRRPKKGDEVWFFNEEELWWQTGIAGNMTRGSVENGVWLAQVSPTQWPKEGGGYTKKQMRVMYPDKKRISWQSQKLCDMGTMQKEFKDNVMAKRLFNVAKSVDKTNPYAYIGLARWFINSNKWDDAYAMCQKAIELEKRWFLPYMYMGIIKRRQGQDAAAAVKTSKKGEPGDNPAEHWRVSLRHFKEAMELNPGNVGAINNLAHFYYYIDKNHRKSCFWHRVLNAFKTPESKAVKNLKEHVQECDEIQHRFDKEEL